MKITRRQLRKLINEAMFDQRFVKSDQIPASTIKADPEIARKISAASTGEGGMAQASSFIDALDADPAVIKMAGGRQKILDRREIYS